MIDKELLLPIIGVILGWMLNSITQSRKDRVEKKKTVALLLTKFIDVEVKLWTAIATTNYIRHFNLDNIIFERARANHFQTKFLSSDNDLVELKKAIDAYALIYPLSAVVLNEIFNLIIFLKNKSLEESCKDNEVYEKTLKMFNYHANNCLKDINQQTLKIACKHSYITYMKVRFTDYRDYKKRKVNKENIENLDNTIVDMNDILEKLKLSSDNITIKKD